MTGKQLRNSILQWAIQGKLVPQDLNDEPASVLLERIRTEKARLVKEKKIKRDKNETIIYRGDDNSHYEKNLATGAVRCIDDELPFDLPDGWAWARLSNIVIIGGGKRLPVGRKLTKEKTQRIYIRVSDMKNGSVSDSDLHYVPTDVISSISNYTISKDDIYITVAGTIGKVGRIPNRFDGANLTENADKLQVIEYEKECLIITLNSPFVQHQIAEVTTKVGQPKLAITRLERILIPIIPVSEQKRIIEKYKNLVLLSEKYNNAYKYCLTLDHELPAILKKSILQEAIQGRLVPQIASEGTAEELLADIRTEKARFVKEGKLKKSALSESVIFRGDDNKYYERIGKTVVDITDEIPFDIPQSWAWCKIKDISTSYIGLTYSPSEISSNGSIVLRSSNIQNGELNLSDIIRVSCEIPEKLLVQNNDILICARNGSRTLVGKSAMIRGLNEPMTFGAFMAICKTSIYDYVFVFLQSPLFFSQLRKNNETTTICQLTQKRFNEFYIPIPPFKEQLRIIAKLDELFRHLK